MPINIDINPHFVKIRDLQVLNFLLNFASLEVGRKRTFCRIFDRQSCQDYHNERKFACPTLADFFSLYMEQKINIPVSLIKRCKREGKTSLEMLACAYLIKSRFQHSTLYNVTVTKVMKFFGCCYKKAIKLMEAFKDSWLFIYNKEKSCLYAKSFKDKTIKRFGRKAHKKYDAISDYCCKVLARSGESLRETVRRFRYILMVNAIHAREMGNFNVGQNIYSVTKPESKCAMTQRLLGNIIGLSRSSGNRYVKRLIDDGVVGKSGIVAECVITELNDETEDAYRLAHPDSRYSVWHNSKNGGWSAWMVYGYAYSLLAKAATFDFKHVIYNYRHTINFEPTISCELDGKWA